MLSPTFPSPYAFTHPSQNLCLHQRLPVPVLPPCSLSSLLLFLLRKGGHPPPLNFRLCLTFGLPPATGLIAPGSCLEGKPITGLSGALMELARLMLSGLSLLSKPLKVSALLGPVGPFPGTASDELLLWVSLWASSDEGSSLDTMYCTCCAAAKRDSLGTNKKKE